MLPFLLKVILDSSVCLPVFIAGEVETGAERLGFASGQHGKPCEYIAVVSSLSGSRYLTQNGQAALR